MSSEPLMSPLDYMTTIDGDRIVPIQVTAIVAGGFIFSTLFINAKPWAHSPQGVLNVPASALTKGSSGRDRLLLVFRLYTLLHLCTIIGQFASFRGISILYFYTNWSFFLETAYFLLAAGTSLMAWKQPLTGKVGNIGALIIILFHVSIAACLVVDILHWGLLWPLLRKTPDPKILAHHTRTTFSWISYNTHGLNLVFILAEMMLNSIPFLPYLMGYMGLYSASYALWAFAFFSNTGKWIYPFLNANVPSAPYVYGAMFSGHLLLLAMVWMLFKFRDKVRGTNLATTAPINGPKPQKVE